MAQGMKLVFKGKPGYEVMSGFGGTSLPSKKTSSQNPRHYWNPGKLSWEEGGLPGMVIHLVRKNLGLPECQVSSGDPATVLQTQINSPI